MTDEEYDHSIPQYYYALNQLGVRYDKLKWNDLAEQCYLKSLDKITIAKYNYASLILTLGKPKDVAIKMLNEYISEYPEDSDGYRELAKAYGWRDRDKRHEMNEKAFQKGWFGDFFEMLIYNTEHFEKHIAQQKNNEIADRIYEVIMEFENLKTLEEQQERKKMVNPKMCNQIGLAIFQGTYFIHQDYKKACKIWEIAINMYDADISSSFMVKEHIPCVKYNLALSYQKGEGVNKDVIKAFELFMQCPDDPDAQREIGDHYRYIEKNEGKAKEWYIKAANNRIADYESCFHLARMYDEIEVKEKAKYFLKGIKRESQVKGNNKLKSYNIPTDVLLYYDAKITKLKRKLIELECRPPGEPGALFLQAQTRFENNVKNI